MLAGYCSAQPLLRLQSGISAFDLNGETGFAPFEVSLLCIPSCHLMMALVHLDLVMQPRVIFQNATEKYICAIWLEYAILTRFCLFL